MARDRELRRDAGFTLVELAVVAVIAMTLLFLATPVLQGNDTLGSAVRELANDSLRTRAMARARWESVTLDFDIANSRWRKVLSDGTPIADQDTDAQGWKMLPEDVSFQAVTGTQDVVFQANGRVATGTSIRVLNDSGAWQLDYSELSGRVVANKI